MKLRERVLTKVPDVKSRAALVLLHEKYLRQLRNYPPKWRIWLTFRNRFLNRKLKKESLTCFYCGEKKLKSNNKVVCPNKQATVDHVMPLSKGGKRFDEKNLVVSCRICNERKADKICTYSPVE